MRWKTIERFPNYEVSNTGLVKRKHHIAEHKNYGQRLMCERIMNASINDYGYVRVRIATKQIFVHRLVLEAFVGECPKGMVTIHKNGDRTDNRLANLKWGYAKNNIHDKRYFNDAKKITVKKKMGPWDYICGLKVA
jgi:HNH endonuclease/NUMOD4 motif